MAHENENTSGGSYFDVIYRGFWTKYQYTYLAHVFILAAYLVCNGLNMYLCLPIGSIFLQMFLLHLPKVSRKNWNNSRIMPFIRGVFLFFTVFPYGVSWWGGWIVFKLVCHALIEIIIAFGLSANEIPNNHPHQN